MPFTLSLSVDYGGRITRKGSGKRAKPFESYELLTDVVLLVVVCCVVSVKGVSPTTKTRALCVAYPQRSCPNTTEVTTSRGEEGVPTNAYIYVFVLWGGAMRKQQHIFLQVAQ